MTVRVDVLPIAQHSGAFGGPLPDAVMALSRMLASLHDDDGEIAIGGLLAFPWPGTQVPRTEFRAESRVFPEIELLGTGTISRPDLSKPAINVLAFEAPRVNEVANQIVPTARAVVGLRMAPGEDYAAAVDKLAAHLRAAAPWGVRVQIDTDEPGAGYIVDPTTPAYRSATSALATAFDRKVVEMGSGGSIPLVPMLAETFPGIEVLIWGAGDHRSNFHSVDESVDVEDAGTDGPGRGAVPPELRGRRLGPLIARHGVVDRRPAGADGCVARADGHDRTTNAVTSSRSTPGRRPPSGTSSRIRRSVDSWIPGGPSVGTSPSPSSTWNALERWNEDGTAPGPWQVAFALAGSEPRCPRSATSCWG